MSERTPLLISGSEDVEVPIDGGVIISHETSAHNSASEVDDTPLPKLQMAVLCLVRAVEPIAFFGIFPFVNKMIKETGDMIEADVGFYSGFIESMFSVTQMILMISWGKLADRVGRKPVMVFSLIGVGVGTALFGLSRTIWQMVIFRCLAGVFAGTTLTVRAMISENSTPRTQARAFSFFAFSGNMGIFLGPLIGGLLQNPVEQYGGAFKRFQFFNDYPYALPTFATASIALIAAAICGLLLKETLKRKPTTNEDGSPVGVEMTTLELAKKPGVAYVIFLYTHTMLLGLGYSAVSPLFWFTSPSLGGFGFTPRQISYFLGTIGIAQAIWLLVFFPIFHRKYGTRAILRTCYYIWPLTYMVNPLCNHFLRQSWTTAFWIVAPIAQVLGSGVSMAFTCVQLALNDVSPNPAAFGLLNALALTSVSGIRAIGPFSFTSIFAAGARSQFLQGYLVWVVLIALALLGTVAMRWFPENAEGKLKQED
ncbi:related to tetracycline resistance protein (probable transport protein) [Rhynchosporium graminicola]|uniref:Related to tetracycline resistance protein (Probable transport protein) n=1 Tax=Rhynchosporium graminicola TaxID=2792576 RepID=A0A1E1KUU6_9HELO|nr:related to tetracycline resistance protein (probable transport protein) [Rhynchosporium commune]